jgi:cysteine desulfurase
MLKKKDIYLDFAAATPIDPRVLKVVRETEKSFWQNPSSIHKGGVTATKVLELNRKKVADVLFAHSDEIIYTSGGTESNNLAILGVLKSFEKTKNTILISSIDHPSIIEPAKSLDKQTKIKFLPVEESGKIDLKNLKKELLSKPILLSFGYVNGEIGVIQDVREIMKIIRHHRKINKTPYPYVHIDATQAVNVLPCQVHRLGIDLMTLDGSKMYGPKCIGMLYKRRGIKLEPIFYGGGQESKYRPGTENLPAIAGFTKALTIAQDENEKTNKHLKLLQNKFLKSVLKKNSDRVLNGPKNIEDRHPGIVSICFPDIDSEQAVLVLDASGISVSATSSCQNLAERSNSYVVQALGKDKCAFSSLRFSFGKSSQVSDLPYVLKSLEKAVLASKHKKFSLN